MNTETTQNSPHTDSDSIDVFLDFACPWSYIGLQRIAEAQNNSSKLVVNYRAFQLNPTLPAEGIPRETYRVNKFGTLTESQRRDGVVTRAAAAEGISINFDGILRTPNTRLAHRALKYAIEQGQGAAFALGIYHAYFTEELDIGDPKILLNIASSLGLQLNMNQLEDENSEQDKAIDMDTNKARTADLSGVPFVVLNTNEGTYPLNLPDAVELIKNKTQ